MTKSEAPQRVRDPERKERILGAAADLVARNGYHAVSMADIGGAAGITGSAIYRHFDGKSAVLVALFDRVIDGLLRDERLIVEQEVTDLSTALSRLIDGQVDFVVGDREIAQVYHREISNLPEADRRGLRRKQRLYLEEWGAPPPRQGSGATSPRHAQRRTAHGEPSHPKSAVPCRLDHSGQVARYCRHDRPGRGPTPLNINYQLYRCPIRRMAALSLVRRNSVDIEMDERAIPPGGTWGESV